MCPKIVDIACSDVLRIFQARSPYWNNFHTPNLYCGAYDVSLSRKSTRHCQRHYGMLHNRGSSHLAAASKKFVRCNAGTHPRGLRRRGLMALLRYTSCFGRCHYDKLRIASIALAARTSRRSRRQSQCQRHGHHACTPLSL